MNLVLHQFRTDLLHFRFRLPLLWLLFAMASVLTAVPSMPVSTAEVLWPLLRVGEALFSLFIIVELIHADPLVGTGAGWLTRPLRRTHLFAAKSAFLILCVLAPWMFFEIATVLQKGFSFWLCLGAAGQSLLFGAAFLLAVAALAALTPSWALFGLGAALTVLGLFTFTFGSEALRNTHWYSRFTLGRPNVDAQGSAMVIAFVGFNLLALVAWILQALGRWTRSAVGCFALGTAALGPLIIFWHINFLSPHTLSVPPVQVVLGEATPASQRLWPGFAIESVPAGQVAVAQRIVAQLKVPGVKRAFSLLSQRGYRWDGEKVRPADSDQEEQYFQKIQGFFPAETLWFREGYPRQDSAFDRDANEQRIGTNLAPGKLTGVINLTLFQVTRVAELPLQRGTFVLLPGERLTLDRPAIVDDAITLAVQEGRASVLLTRDPDLALRSMASAPGPFFSYVLYNSRRGEAFALAQGILRSRDADMMNSESRRDVTLRFPYPALHAQLGGVSAAEWLQDAHLWVFAPQYRSSGSAGFACTNFTFDRTLSGGASRLVLSAAQATQNASLPANPTPNQVSAYLDALLNPLPSQSSKELKNLLRSRLEALGTNGLGALLQRLPLQGWAEESCVLPAVSSLADRSCLPELLGALKRDDLLATVFLQKGWQAEAQPVLTSRLSDHRRVASVEVLQIVAAARNPATYPDLLWHFEHLDKHQDQVLPLLAQCPGLEVTEAVRQAWKRARLGLCNTSDLAIAAAQQGLPDALTAAVMNLDNVKGSQRSQQLTALTSLTGYRGPEGDAPAWLNANLARFQFVPAQGKWQILPAGKM